ncbi:MAG: hypothetical protein CMJ42_06295 [Phyllobacteriaceae bacterium]|uniref:DUF2274 domain-containing protein n=1 Tax=Stappia sp. TaxID=1870903 RepID=UPI000C6255B6|nr:DUF2274 domain-containing protein [Stappia sp.]MAW86126.1 hypothetical protein [Phyllobacteriaceae bacterium]MBM20278.1 hypothetical protein [Stappia sp.]
MSNLKLGPLPKRGIVRMTVPMPEPLKEELDLYAAEYGRQYGEVDTATLIPHMLEAFLRSDRGWRSRKAKLAGEAATAGVAKLATPAADH